MCLFHIFSLLQSAAACLAEHLAGFVRLLPLDVICPSIPYITRNLEVRANAFIKFRFNFFGEHPLNNQEDFAIRPAFISLPFFCFLCRRILESCFSVWSDDWQPGHHMGAVRNAASWAPVFFLGGHTRRHTCLGGPLIAALR